MKLEFNQRNVVVLGSSSGIGFAIAKALVKNGANVCLVGRDLPKLQQAYTEINQLSSPKNKNIYISADLTENTSTNNIWQLIADKWNGNVDSLVLNAGGPPFIENVTDVPLANWQTYFQSLFLSQIMLVGKCIENMRKNNFGRIISISSSTIVTPLQGMVISGTLRSALAAWLKSLSMDVGKDGITAVTAIIGKIDTERINTLNKNRAKAFNCTATDVANEDYKHIPAGRYGTLDEVANAIIFLLSKQASYISGSSITIDGGSGKRYY